MRNYKSYNVRLLFGSSVFRLSGQLLNLLAKRMAPTSHSAGNDGAAIIDIIR